MVQTGYLFCRAIRANPATLPHGHVTGAWPVGPATQSPQCSQAIRETDAAGLPSGKRNSAEPAVVTQIVPATVIRHAGIVWPHTSRLIVPNFQDRPDRQRTTVTNCM